MQNAEDFVNEEDYAKEQKIELAKGSGILLAWIVFLAFLGLAAEGATGWNLSYVFGVFIGYYGRPSADRMSKALVALLSRYALKVPYLRKKIEESSRR